MNINGIDFNNVEEVSGVSKSLILNINGVPVSSPCIEVQYGYTGNGFDPYEACRLSFEPYSFDDNLQIIYLYGQCGTTVAPTGYYSDGNNIFLWQSKGLQWTFWGYCKE